MTKQRPAPARRAVLRSLAAASAAGLAGCQCAAASPSRTLVVEAAEEPVEYGGGWRLGLDVEHELVNAGDEPFAAAQLVAFDTNQEQIGEWGLEPFSEGGGYDHSSESTCGGSKHAYTKSLTLRTDREPKYVNPFVPRSECAGGEVSTRPLIVGEDRSPTFRCAHRFPFAVFDVADAPAHDHEDWPTALFDAARTARNPDGSGPGSEPAVAWTLPVGRKSTRPVVDYGAVYLTADGYYAGEGAPRFPRGTLAAFDVETGDLAWSADDGGSELGMAVADGRLFAGQVELAAYEAATGRRLWSVEPADPLATAPAVAGDSVTAVDRGGVARAFATEGGEQQWEREVGAPVIPPVWGIGGVLAADGESLYVVVEGAVTALDLRSGETRWGRSLESPEGVPQVGDDTVYAVTGDTLVALATDDGTERWRRTMELVRPTVVVGPDSVYVSGSGEVSALAAADGTPRWSTAIDEVRSIRGLVNGRLYVTGTSGIHVLDAAAGDHLGTWLDDVEFQFPVLADGRIVDVSDDGALRVLVDD